MRMAHVTESGVDDGRQIVSHHHLLEIAEQHLAGAIRRFRAIEMPFLLELLEKILGEVDRPRHEMREEGDEAEVLDGIAHRLKMEIFGAIKRIQRNGTAILMAEQDAQSALRIADRVYVLEHGRVGREGTSAELAADDYIRQAYLGVA